jgi:hypothetical protein
VEWNGALQHATFNDDQDAVVNIRPQAWEMSLGYQFDWNPTVVEIGAQGTYLALSYSESHELAGLKREVRNDAGQIEEVVRFGFVPRKRFLVGVGEWVLDGLRVAVEYAYITDYPVSEGGTGNSAHGWFGMLTYEW